MESCLRGQSRVPRPPGPIAGGTCLVCPRWRCQLPRAFRENSGPRVRSSAAGFSLSQINISAWGVYSSSSFSCEHLDACRSATPACLHQQAQLLPAAPRSILLFRVAKKGTGTHGGTTTAPLACSSRFPGEKHPVFANLQPLRGNPSDASRSSSSPSVNHSLPGSPLPACAG